MGDNVKGQNLFFRAKYAFQGLAFAFKTETSFKLELLAIVFIFAVLCYLQPAPIWWALIALTCAGVLACELINTALERALDKLHPVRDPLIGQAKDCAAAAVLVLSLISLFIFGALLWEMRSQLS
jgi:undecaprenol kinase